MIRLMLVAGNNSQKLTDFLSKRGAFEVTYTYSSLNHNLNELQTSIVRTDKFLYLYNPELHDSTFDIRAEMKALGILLKDTSFFNPGEIIFMVKASDESGIALKYFKTIMQDTGYENYSIKQITGQLSYEAIYNSIMGVSSVREFENTYRDFYKVERNSEADLAYTAKDDRNLKIEPFNFDSLHEYEGRKDIAAKTDSGQVVTDSADTILPLTDNPEFVDVSVRSVLSDKKVVLVSGRAKSGKSVWGTVLSVSAIAAGCTTAIFDYTANSDLERHLNLANAFYKKVGLKDGLTLESMEKGSMVLFSVKNVRENKVKVNFLRHKVTITNDSFDAVVVVCELEDLDKIYTAIEDSVTNIVLTCTAFVEDLGMLYPYADKYKDLNLKIVLNESLSLIGVGGYCSAEEASAIFPKPFRLVKAKNFVKLNHGAQIYKAIVEG